jgi:hypothetical protein
MRNTYTLTNFLDGLALLLLLLRLKDHVLSSAKHTPAYRGLHVSNLIHILDELFDSLM